MKHFLLLLVCVRFCFFTADAQQFRDDAGRLMGTFDNGQVRDASGRLEGRYERGQVRDSAGRLLGSVKYGRVRDSAGRLIGNYAGISEEEATLRYFFFFK